MEMKKAALIGLAGVAVGFVMGYGTGRVSTGTPISPLSSGSGSYQDGYNAAKKKLAESGVLPSSATETSMLAGTISTIDAGILTLEVDMRSPNPLEEAVGPKVRRVTIDANTRLVRISEKSQEAYALELEAFDKVLRDASPDAPPPVPPSLFAETAIEITDLKAGDRVSVTADHDVSTEAAFAATVVMLMPASAAPAPALPPTPAATP